MMWGPDLVLKNCILEQALHWMLYPSQDKFGVQSLLVLLHGEETKLMLLASKGN